MVESVENALPYITSALFGLALLLFVIAFRLFRRSRTDVYWRRRRDASQRGLRLFMTAIVLLLASGVACLSTLLVTMVSNDQSSDEGAPVAITTADTESPIITATLEQIITAVQTESAPLPEPSPTAAGITPATAFTAATQTPAPTVVVVVTATLGATHTLTPFPTFTPHAAPLVSAATPRASATITITALDDQISDVLTPINPRTTFAEGTSRIYLFVDYRGMAEGVLWKRHLYYESELIDGNSYLWGQDSDGSSYFFFGNDSGFEPGNYEIRLYIGDRDEPESALSFSVLPVS